MCGVNLIAFGCEEKILSKEHIVHCQRPNGRFPGRLDHLLGRCRRYRAKWSQMEPNGAKWSKREQSGAKSSQVEPAFAPHAHWLSRLQARRHMWLRREGRCFMRFTFQAPNDPPYRVPRPFLHFCLLCGSPIVFPIFLWSQQS